eukprot:1151403-Pelagomonas_calceolata.AAC.1
MCAFGTERALYALCMHFVCTLYALSSSLSKRKRALWDMKAHLLTLLPETSLHAIVMSANVSISTRRWCKATIAAMEGHNCLSAPRT